MSDEDLDDAAETTPPVISSRPIKSSSLGDMAQILVTEPPNESSKSVLVNGSEPFKAHANCVLLVDDVVKDTALKIYLRDVFTSQIHREYPVVEFVKKVFSYSPSDIPGYDDGKEYAIPVSHFQTYANIEGENNCYPSLIAILNDLVRQLCNNPNAVDRALLGQFICMYERQPTSATGAKLKPDLFFSTDPDKDEQDWMTGLGYLEVARRQKVKKGYKGPKVIDWKAFEREPTKYEPVIPKLVPEPKDKPINSSSPSSPTEPASSAENEASGSANPPLRRSKRKLTLEASPDEAFYRDMPSPPLQKKSRLEIVAARMATGDPPASEDCTPASEDPVASIALTEKELQSAKYINEMMSHGVRNFGTGVLLEETDVTLWYADRMGLVQSASFDFMKKPHLLLLVLAAYTFADLPKLGLCPLLTYPYEDQEFNGYKGVTLDLPVAQDIEYKEHTDLSFMIAPRSRIETDLGTIGRGTTLITVKPTGKAAELFGNNWFAAKLAWPAKARTGEDTLIRVIRKKLKEKKPHYLKHIVDLKCSLSRDISELGLPRSRMSDLPTLANCEPRVFRCLVMQAYNPLETIESAEEFKTVFLDTVRAHHWVFVTSGVLHRDVSLGNLMYYRAPDNTIRGVLCDWDLAEKVYDSKDEGPRRREIMEAGGRSEAMEDDVILLGKHEDDHLGPCYRTGTGPFMALDLLVDGDPPKHKYRDDLESFFWVLVCHCAVYDPVTGTYGHIKNWESKNLAFIGDSKRKFLDDIKIQKQVFKLVHPDYRPLLKLWVYKLIDLFLPVNVTDWHSLLRCLMAQERAVEDGDMESQAAIQIDIRNYTKKRDEAITYEKFMACLGVDVSVEE